MTDTTNNSVEIPIKSLFEEFSNHLTLPNNKRIFFSGKYGIGKTYFLTKFFEEYKNQYEVFHIFPVRYQISSNDNIIEFIKYDILVELLKMNPELLKSEDLTLLSKGKIVGEVLIKNKFDIFKRIFPILPYIGRPISEYVDFIEYTLKLIQEIKTKSEDNEEKLLKDYIKEIRDKDYTETDYLSQLIKNKIKKHKGEKKSVLIIDDIERIDPEHVFRILNVFSAHLNLHGSEIDNKFGFDKIVLVADIHNIRSIFHHKYGENTDFSGYLDKFFSFEVFHIKNEDIIIQFIDNLFTHYKIEDEIIIQHRYISKILWDILKRSTELTGRNKVSLRQLLSPSKYLVKSLRKGSYKQIHPFEENGKNYAILQALNIIVKTIISIYGTDDNDLVCVLKQIRQSISMRNKEMHSSYNFFIKPMLSTVKGKIMEENKAEIWNEYRIVFKDNKVLISEDKNNSDMNSLLFYDLLMEYIEKKYHERISTSFTF